MARTQKQQPRLRVRVVVPDGGPDPEAVEAFVRAMVAIATDIVLDGTNPDTTCGDIFQRGPLSP